MSSTRFFYAAQDGHTVDDGVIRAVSVITKGEAKGHDVWTDDAFLDAVVEQGNAAPRGIKSRFGHPAMLADAMGSYIGRLKNFRRDGQKALADLHLSRAAKKSPKGDLYEYVSSLAKDEADQFGLSIAFDDDGVYRSDDDAREYVRLGKLIAVDVVDEPAANPSGLFANKQKNEEVKQPASVAVMTLSLPSETKNKEEKEMELINQMIEKFGAEKAARYFAAGLDMEKAQARFASDNAAAELDALRSAMAEKDGVIAKLTESVSALEARIAEMGKGSDPVAMSAAPAEEKRLTFSAVVAGLVASGKTQFDAIREAAKAHKDLHAEWLKSEKTKFNTVI